MHTVLLCFAKDARAHVMCNAAAHSLQLLRILYCTLLRILCCTLLRTLLHILCCTLLLHAAAHSLLHAAAHSLLEEKNECTAGPAVSTRLLDIVST